LQHDHSFCPQTASGQLLIILFSDLAAPCTTSWAEKKLQCWWSWSMFDEQTPIQECIDIDVPLSY
jgi:hypothetical protein